MKLPLKITVDPLKSMNDQPRYLLTVEVPGNKRSATVSVVRLDEDDHPELVEVRQNGLSMLVDAIRDEIVYQLFRLAYNKIVEVGGTSIEWSISDSTKLIERLVGWIEADDIGMKIGEFVDPSLLVPDMLIVRDD